MPKKQKRSDIDHSQQETVELPRLTKLRKAWMKATEEERAAFLKDLSLDEALLLQRQERTLVANGRYLLQSTIDAIERVMVKRNIRPSQIAVELGFPEEGASLARALAKGASLRLSMVRALAAWLEEQERAVEH
ncbi:MAG TPA: hypothetical protein VGO22_17915 [Pseudorhizobium sp.]|nr:hypothetical protein [Pseudorhizobium sp.]